MRCCVTGTPVWRDQFSAFRSTHIFPVAHADVLLQLDFARYIEDDAENVIQGPNGINSIQNGMLLRSDVHARFDLYEIAIDPDDNYRIVDFTHPGSFEGGTLWRNTSVAPQYQVSDALLREHFRQCVLANVRGAGELEELAWDHEADEDLGDFEQWGEKVAGGKSRLEIDLAARLNGFSASSSGGEALQV